MDLHGQVIDQEGGSSLTLHDPAGMRILGYDYAHAPKNLAQYANRTLPYDHRQRSASDLGVR